MKTAKILLSLLLILSKYLGTGVHDENVKLMYWNVQLNVAVVVSVVDFATASMLILNSYHSLFFLLLFFGTIALFSPKTGNFLPEQLVVCVLVIL